MKSFWMIFVACFIFSFSFVATAQLEDPSAGSAAAEHIKANKVLTCEDVAECGGGEAAPKKEVVKSARWVECLIPPEVKILDENGTYVTQKSPPPTWQVGQECVCPEGYSRSKSYRLRSKSEKDGKVYESWDVAGVCLPLLVEPNAEVIADGLNHLREFISRVELMATNTDKEVAGIKVVLGGHTEMIEYNRQEIGKLRADVKNLNVFMKGACAAPNLSEAWREFCEESKRAQEDIENLKNAKKVIRYGLGASYTRYPGRNFFGAAGELSFISPRFTPDSPLRLEAAVRGVLGSASDMDEDGDSALALETTVLAGPVVDLDPKGQYKLHIRGFGQQATEFNFVARSRRAGGELAFSFAPSAEAGSQGSFYVMPSVNLGYGKSSFHEPRTETESAYTSTSSSVTGGVAVTFGGQF